MAGADEMHTASQPRQAGHAHAANHAHAAGRVHAANHAHAPSRSHAAGGVDEVGGLVHVRRSPVHGHGVFALVDIALGQVIERCPCVVLENGWEHVDTVLHDYLYCWPREGDGRAVVLGHGSVFNHDAKPNADWVTDVASRVFIYRAVAPIAAGQEVFIDYGQDYWTTEHAASTHYNRLSVEQLVAIARNARQG